MNVAIIAAAGQGTRMAGSLPKQFLELAGTPILFRTVRVFDSCEAVEEIIVVVPSRDPTRFKSLIERLDCGKPLRFVSGGSTRAESVYYGLQSAPSATEIVVVHDGVRPFVTPQEIGSTIDGAKEVGAAILGSKPVDTIKEVRDGNVVRTLRRDDLRNALTPQSFQYQLLLNAYRQVDVLDPALTDESSIAERAGMRIATIEGSSRNIKITREEDLILAEAIMRGME
jgi:2-C-methyl-D-erythritol 4-phosphate cytidylyltransferase